MGLLDQISKIGLVPVVAFESADIAVPAVKAMRDAQLDVVEITMRTSAGIESIRRVKAEFPDMIVGAGTVLTLGKAKESVEAGAQFIVMPGYQDDIVTWCIDNDIPVMPGCVTPTEINLALQKGLKILKFFPADVYGGIKALKALNAPFGSTGLSFVPTGGVDLKNLTEFAQAPFVAAIGGSWLCSSKQLKEGDFAGITKTVRDSINVLLGFEMGHLGMNTSGAEECGIITKKLTDAFQFPLFTREDANFAGEAVEIVKGKGSGELGHVAIRTNNVARAVYYLEKRGFKTVPESAIMKDGRMILIYLKDEIGGFAFHLRQK